MQYPVAIEWGDDNVATGIVIPDIPGTHTAGDSVEAAYAAVVEIAHIQLEALLALDKELPLPSRIEKLKGLPEFAGYGWGIVEIDITPYLGKQAAHR
ncbi:MAG TPA: type II toxin-antitoxin system HicB family antitoxin [Candidatus Acidoferrum sp.]|nr:type II toxin-antitoxin system HicB family antitoxin [Candidatus Acidoferrum sp.]